MATRKSRDKVGKSAPARREASLAETARDKARVFVVDDHPIVRQGLVQLLSQQGDLRVIGEGADVYESLRAIRATPPDLCLVDVTLKDGDGLELIKELKSGTPDVAILVLSMHDEQLYAERALRAGARGYVMKGEPPATLLDAIRRVLAGEVYVSPAMGSALLSRALGHRAAEAGTRSSIERLTDRELEIFRLIGAGLTVREIAERLFLSGKTVEAHRENIKQKLGIRTSNELLRFAIRNTPDAG
jgi:DNA-binding NarL/FixJ family response regulator